MDFKPGAIAALAARQGGDGKPLSPVTGTEGGGPLRAKAAARLDWAGGRAFPRGCEACVHGWLFSKRCLM